MLVDDFSLSYLKSIVKTSLSRLEKTYHAPNIDFL